MCKDTTKKSNMQVQLELFQFEDLKKPVEVSFTAPDLSSLGGLHLLHGVNLKQGFLPSLCSHIQEWRNEDLIVHSIQEMVTQRVFQIQAGYEDADDCDALRKDSMLKMCVGLLPSDHPLSSQPTMTRLENHVTHSELYGMGKEFVMQFIRSYKKVPSKIILDFDDSNSNTYGAQQLSLFNEYYGEYCYMPLYVFEGYSGRLILPLLRPGRVSKRINVFGLMRRLIMEIRKHWKHTVIIVRGDAMFCSNDFMEWAKPQWVITKVECNGMGTNVRHVVTSFYMMDPKVVYEKLYCKRGDCELYIKELKEGLWSDRMSCSKFTANQFRLFMHAAAYVLMLEAKQTLFRKTGLADCTVSTFREKVILTAVRITEYKTKIKVEYVRDHPIRDKIRAALRRSA